MGITRNLGQVAGIIISSSEPENNQVLWYDTVNDLIKAYNAGSSSWDPIGSEGTGLVRLTVGDSLDYLSTKLDESLEVIADELKVTVPVTSVEKTKWDGQTTTYLVDNTTARDALSEMQAGDRCIVTNDGDGERAGYYWTGSQWKKDFDPDWENTNLLWANVVDGGDFFPLATKVIDIGDWNMDIAVYKDVTHELTKSNIKRVSAMIRDDNDTWYYDFKGVGVEYIQISDTVVKLVRTAGGYFDAAVFATTSYNRGYVVIDYIY